jgi:bacteriorhodopsin
MAEIRVEERKRGMGWLWGLIALVIVALLIWYFMSTGDGTADDTLRDTIGMLDDTRTTAFLQLIA